MSTNLIEIRFIFQGYDRIKVIIPFPDNTKVADVKAKLIESWPAGALLLMD
jgi:hypothetical protein